MSFDPLPTIDLPQLDLRGQFYTSSSPVQAWGTIRGHAFYFRARHEHWDFAISESSDTDLSDIFSNIPGDRLFIREGRYAYQKFAASYMPLDAAAEIIERCATEYVQTQTAQQIAPANSVGGES